MDPYQQQSQQQHQQETQQQMQPTMHSSTTSSSSAPVSNKHQRQAAMLKQHRDQAAYTEIPENHPSHQKKRLLGRQPSDLIQAELEHPMMNLTNFKPALDEFLKNGPSSDVEKVKNLAAEIAAMNSQLDAGRISTEIDNTMGIGESQKFGRMASGDNLGFSINSFSSLVDFGDLGDSSMAGPGSSRINRNMSWQKSVSDLMPSDDAPEKFHKEYKCFESNDKKRLTSKEWKIDYSMNTTTFTPTNEASTELTNNVVTYVQLNDLNNDAYNQGEGLARPQPLRDDKRQMSVEINTANIGIDPEGRLGSYELITTELKMEPIDLLDPTPLPPQGYRVDNNILGGGDGYGTASVPPIYEQQPMNTMLNSGHAPLLNNNGNFHHQVQRNHQHQPNHHVRPNHQLQPNLGFHAQTPYMSQEQNQSQLLQQRPNTISQPELSIGTQIRGLGLIVPSRADMPMAAMKLGGGTGVIDHHEIQDGDVLLERGGKGNHHKGSRYYRRLINERRPSYQDLPDSARAEKMAISLSVVMSVKSTGARFIHKRKGQYIVMSDREARNKISQALREKKERVMLDA